MALKNITKDQIVTLRFGGYEKELKPQAVIEVPVEFEKMLVANHPARLEIVTVKAKATESAEAPAPVEEQKPDDKGKDKGKDKKNDKK